VMRPGAHGTSFHVQAGGTGSSGLSQAGPNQM
jgi:hypothetical protein